MQEKNRNSSTYFSFRKRETPPERRVDDRFRAGDQRGPNDIRSNSYRERSERIDRIERNDGIDRPPPRMDRGRQMSPVQRQERERFDRRPPPENDFRRDRRDEGNPVEWRPKDRPQGE